MMAKRVPIDTYCEKKIPTLQKTYDGLIDYVDISSVDNTEKRIISYQTIEATDAPSRAKQLLKKGDVIVSTVRPNLNAVAVVEKEPENLMVGSTGYCVLRCNDNMDVRYLFNFCQSQYFVDDMSSQATGASYPAVSNSIVRSSLIPCYSIEKQREIAERMDTVSELLALRKQQLAELDELVKSRFIELFGDPVANDKGWNTKPLLEMGFCKNGMNFHYEDTGVEINCLGVGNFKDYSTISDTSVLPTVSLNEMPSDDYMLKDDDIVFVRSNGNKALVGRSVAVYPGKVPTTFSGFCIRYRKTDDTVNIPYLLRALKTESIRKKMAGRGANIQNLNQQILGTLIIPVPPIELQNRFAAFVEQTDKSKLAIQQSLEQLETLKKSLMQQYFG